MGETVILAVVLSIFSIALVGTVVYLLARLAKVTSAKNVEMQAWVAERTRLDDEHRRELAEIDDAARAARIEVRELRASLEQREQRLGAREDRLQVDRQALDDDRSRLVADRVQLDADREAVGRERSEVHQELVRVAGMTDEQAKQELMAMVEHEARLEAATLARDIEQAAVRDAEAKARFTIVTAIQRLASEQTAESVVTTVELPSEEMKGRIIGREGRNIRSFEQVTGVNVMIDDTPGSVLLSSFDPVRRAVASATLTELVADGRIHPARIENAYARNKAKTDEHMSNLARQALAEVGITKMHESLLPIIGSLAYRTSYGQNVLRHLVECGKLAGLMASELGLNPTTCIRAAFLHDIGKALTGRIEGSHAAVGAELAESHGESPEVVHAIAAHHNEIQPTTIEAVLTQAADAISGSRPGARRESLEAYVHRLERLEEIAGSYPGVQRVFAMQAGREVRVMVSPEDVDDAQTQLLARDIAQQIEQELTYPGQIHITVVRESRAMGVAH